MLHTAVCVWKVLQQTSKQMPEIYFRVKTEINVLPLISVPCTLMISRPQIVDLNNVSDVHLFWDFVG